MSRRLRSLVLFAVTAALLYAAVAWQGARPGEQPSGQPRDERLPVLQQSARYWKGNLHTHSLWSDGDDFPEMIADWYRRHDYNFLALSDHNVLSEGQRWLTLDDSKSAHAAALRKYRARFGDQWVQERTRQGKRQVRLKPLAELRSLLEEPGRFLMIPGEEITHSYARAPVHLNAINLRDVVRPIDGGSVAETIQVNHRAVDEQARRTGRGMITSLNHPNFGWGVRAEDMAATEELRFFEVYNGHPSVRNYGDAQHPSCERMWDILLALRLRKYHLPVVYGMASDDAHGYHAFGAGKANPGRGWLMVKAPHLSAEAIVESLQAGDFYASTGVVLSSVRHDHGQLTVSIQAQPGVTYHTEFIATLRDAPLVPQPRRDERPSVADAYGPEIGKVVADSHDSEVSYRLKGNELYVRARITSSRPHPNPFRKGDVEMAWTQPIVP